MQKAQTHGSGWAGLGILVDHVVLHLFVCTEIHCTESVCNECPSKDQRDVDDFVEPRHFVKRYSR